MTPQERGRRGAARQRAILDAAFWDNTDRSTGCWVWQGWKRPDGYGTIRRGGRVLRVHRLAYERVHGPIADGLVVMHSCDNPPCINPEHLSLGTTVDNTLDATRKGRMCAGPRQRFYRHGGAVERGRRQRAWNRERRRNGWGPQPVVRDASGRFTTGGDVELLPGWISFEEDGHVIEIEVAP
jgi:hypothetical protein